MYDCIVVGAGPAGGAAAYHLAKRGRNVLILERESLPRYKPCGGGVSPAIAEWFDFDFSPAISMKVSKIRCTSKMSDPVEVELETPEPIWMVRREVFDHLIIEQAQKLGAELRDNTEVKGIEFKNDSWQVSTANGAVSARYLIAADGAQGPMAKWLGFKERKTRIADAVEAQASNLEISQAINFDFGIVKNGYAWSFPKADGLSLGAGTFIGGEPRDFQKIFADFGTSLGVNASNGKYHGYALSLWNGEQKLHTQNALLVGEAASIVDPMTAEGIRPAIFTGMKAAEAIDQALGGNQNALDDYSHTVNAEWGADLNWAGKIAGLLYRFPGVGYKVGVKRPTGPQLMGKILCGQLRYSDVAGRAIKRLTPFG